MRERQVTADRQQGSASPFWSVMIPTYRPTIQLREAVESVLRALQGTDGRAQIEVVDDASPDVDVLALLDAWGFADKVNFFRRPDNGGLGKCWNTCVARASGKYVHILHQDDLVKPAFYLRMQSVARAHSSAGMIFCQTEFLEATGTRLDRLEQPTDGLLPDWLKKISAGQRLQCPSVVVKRELYQHLGGFDASLRYVIDWVMWVKIAACSEVAYVAEPLAVYRIHEGAETKKIKAAGISTRDLALGLKRISHILDEAGRQDCLKDAGGYALRASGFAIYEAEAAGAPQIAAREVATSLRYLGRFMTMMQILLSLKSYVRFRLKALV